MPRFTGGGAADGLAREVPPGAVTAITPATGGGSSYYARDDSGDFRFIGFGIQGASMAGIIRREAGTERRDREAAEAAMRPRGCTCGLIFIGSAFDVHRDPGWPGGCLPPGALGQLEERDGVWVLAGSAAGC
jgi:hypothetical protein